MKFLSRYFKDYIKESILGPVFKLLEACFELLVPLIIAYIVDTIIPNGSQGNLVAMLFTGWSSMYWNYCFTNSAILFS